MNKPTPLYRRVLAAVAWIANAMLWIICLSVYVSPASCRWAGVLCLGFPFALVAVCAVLVLLLIVSPKMCYIPVVGVAACMLTARTYFPVNFPSTAPAGAIKIMSYNVCGWGGNKTDSAGHNEIAKYIAASGADIVCCQESYATDKVMDDAILPCLNPCLPYNDSIKMPGGNAVCIFSRYPILGKEKIFGQLNGAAAFRLLLAPEDTVTVVNCHLESMHLTPEDRKQYHELVRQPEETDVEGSSRMLVSKLSRATARRALQADSVADYLARHRGRSVILCGDFNDTPVSYVHWKIGRGLTDAYRATGNGLGRSFNRDAIIVRIDNVFCSEDWQPYGFHIDNSTLLSDHYPIVGWLKRKEGR